MSSNRINAAEAATTATEDAIGKASRALTADRFVNGFGIYTDRPHVLTNLHTAKLAIEAAVATLRSTEWPNDADYAQM